MAHLTSSSSAPRYFVEWLLLGSGLVLFGLFVAFVLYGEYRAIDQQERLRLATQARVVHDVMVRQIEATNRALQAVRIDLPLWRAKKDGWQEAVRQLKALTDAMPGVRTMLIVDGDGKVLVSNREELIGLDVTHREYFLAPKRQPDAVQLYVSPPFRSVLGAWTLNVSRAIVDGEGRFGGIVTAAFDPGEFFQHLESVRYAHDMWSALIHGDGQLFLMVPNRSEAFGSDLIKPDSFLSRHWASGQEATVVTGSLSTSGGTLMVAKHIVQPAILHMDKPLIVAIGRELGALYRPWRQQAGLFGSFYVLIMLASVVILAYSQQRRRQAEQAMAVATAKLREKQRQMERFFAVALDLQCVADAEGRLRQLNPAWQELIGAQLDTLEGMRLIDLVHPDDKPATEQALVALSQGQRIDNLVLRCAFGGDAWRSIEWRMAPGDDGLIYAAARDITARLRDAQALAESEHFLRSLIDIIPGMVSYWDETLHLRFANAAYRAWFAGEQASIESLHACRLLGEEQYRHEQAFMLAALAGQSQRSERTLTGRDGTTRIGWTHYVPDWAGGKVRGFFVLITDITEIKQTELALREALAEANRFRTALDHVTSFIYMKGRDHRYVYANQPTLTLFGVTAEELRGSSDERFFPPATVERLWQVDERVLKGEATAEEIDVDWGERGRRVYWEIKTPIWDEKGEIWGLCGISTDITERKLQEEALEQARRAAEAASLAKSAFVASMSHEIRTPMNAVLGLLQLLAQTPLDAKQRDYVAKAETAGRSLLGLLSDILDFSRVEAGRLELEHLPFDLDALLNNLAVMLSAAMRDKKIELLFDVDPTTPRALIGDALRLQQVLLNLAGNAIKFTEQGEVVLTIRPLALDGQTARLEFAVRDTGIGISAEQQKIIFEGFRQAESSTSRRYGGSGLGLAISQRLVGLMGGELKVDSALGHGSVFSFVIELPRDPAAISATAVPDRSPRVLIVDDNPSARSAMNHAAQFLGWQATLAANGEEAWQLCQQAAEQGMPFEAVFLDLTLPGLDGVQTARQLRQRFTPAPRLVLVFLSVQDISSGLPETDRHLFDALLSKPVTSAMLRDVLSGKNCATSLTAEVKPAAARLAGLRLLLVEDNATNRLVASELLLREGAFVESAEDGPQALAHLANRHYDAILMDMQMPGMDGYEVTRRIRAQPALADVPIIAMTANALPADRAACLAAGMNDHLGKPIEIDTVVETLLRHCRPASWAEAASAAHQEQPIADPSNKSASSFAEVAMVALQPISEPSCSDLPEVEGFELAAALARLNHDRALWAMLARIARADHGRSVEQAHQLWTAGDVSGALHTLHTLKGVAATLGARTVADRAQALEQGIKNSALSASEIAVAFAALQEVWAATLDELERLADRLAPPQAGAA